jgi:Zn-dependent alcohol dehydrogenase
VPLSAAAAVREAGQPFTIEEVVLYGSADPVIVVRTVASGRCRADLAVQAGHLEFSNQES